MDDRGFDALARAMAAGRNRRQVVRALLGLGAGAVAVGAVTEAEAARRGYPGPRLPTTCVPQCNGTTCGQSNGCGGVCECASGKCVNGGCFQSCTDDGGSCGEPACLDCFCMQDLTGVLRCLDTGTDVGDCSDNADCPAGSLCSTLTSGRADRAYLCTYPCCP